MARFGEVGHGAAGAVGSGEVRTGEAWQARSRMACHGVVGHGGARHGLAGEVRRVADWLVTAWSGRARFLFKGDGNG